MLAVISLSASSLTSSSLSINRRSNSTMSPSRRSSFSCSASFSRYSLPPQLLTMLRRLIELWRGEVGFRSTDPRVQTCRRVRQRASTRSERASRRGRRAGAGWVGARVSSMACGEVVRAVSARGRGCGVALALARILRAPWVMEQVSWQGPMVKPREVRCDSFCMLYQSVQVPTQSGKTQNLPDGQNQKSRKYPCFPTDTSQTYRSLGTMVGLIIIYGLTLLFL